MDGLFRDAFFCPFGLVAGPVGGLVELHALEHGALEALDFLSGRSCCEAEDLFVQLEFEEVLGVSVDEGVDLVDDDEVAFLGFKVKVIVVVDIVFVVCLAEVVLEGFLVSLHDVRRWEHEVYIFHLLFVQRVHSRCSDDPGLPLAPVDGPQLLGFFV